MNNDRITELYEGAVGSWALQQRARERIHWMCREAKGSRVLDVGCSQGVASLLLGREGKQVIGVDREAEPIEFARARLAEEEAAVRARVEFVHAEASELDVPPESIDTVLLGEVLEHQVDWTRLLDLAHDVLRPGGRVVVTTPYGLFPYHDHKQPIYLRDLWRALAERFDIRSTALIDAYLAVTARRSRRAPRGLRGRDWEHGAGIAERRLAAVDELAEERRRKLHDATAELVTRRERVEALEQERERLLAQAEVEGEALRAGAEHAEEQARQLRALEQERDRLLVQAEVDGEALRAGVEHAEELTRQLRALEHELDREVTDGDRRLRAEVARRAKAEEAWRLASTAGHVRSEVPADAPSAPGDVVSAELSSGTADEGSVAEPGSVEEPGSADVEPPDGETLSAALSRAQRQAVAGTVGPEAHAIAPADVPAMLELARDLRRSGRLAEALELAVEAAGLEGEQRLEARLLGIEIGARLPDTVTVLRLLDELGSIEQLERSVQRRIAVETLRAGEHERALEIATLLLDRVPNDETGLRVAAIARWELGDDTPAADMARMVRAGVDDEHLALALRFFLHVDDLDLAVEAARQLDRPDAGLVVQLANRLRAAGRLEAAVDLCDRVLHAAPRSPGATRVREEALGMEAARERSWRGSATPVRLSPVPGRILHLVERTLPYHQSGSTVRTHAIARSQAAAGLEAHVAAQVGFPFDLGYEAAPRELIEGVTYHRLVGDRADRVDERIRANVESLCGLVARLRPALLHAASTYVNGEVALELGRRFGLPVVYEVRGFPEERLLARAGSKVRADTYAVERELERRCADEADHVVTLAEVMRQHLLDRGLDEQRVTVVPNAVDCGLQQPLPIDAELESRLGLPRSATIVGYVSTLAPYEGIEYLLEALAQLRAGGRDVHGLIVGDGPRRWFLERTADALGLSSAVTFTGAVPHSTVASYYALIDVFVVPRTHDPAARLVTPLKPYEAMAFERAVVLSDTPALREMGREGETASFAPPEDSSGLADVIAPLVDDADLRARLGRSARRWVAQERSWTHNTEIYKRVYAGLGAL